MTHACFVVSAFAITSLGTVWLIASSWISMRRSEALADDLRKRP
jgi:heme exporter protein D